MSLIPTNHLKFLKLLSQITYCNPFHPERIEYEQQALGEDFQPESRLAWSRSGTPAERDRPNVEALSRRAIRILEEIRPSSGLAVNASDFERELYDDLMTYVLYYQHFAADVRQLPPTTEPVPGYRWKSFRDDFHHYASAVPGKRANSWSAEHLFACLDQVRRAFRQIYECILGDSAPMAQLRAKVWQSVFTHDMRRYRRSLFTRMAEISTLITGPSGTGKDLVAQAIGRSQYVSFDPRSETFTEDPLTAFIPLNLSAFSPTLIESELFGHRKGAFTGAVSEAEGWLSRCRPQGAIFLDEIGELDSAIQVKLLRLLQTRTYARLGETTERHFTGKVIAATNRNLNDEIRLGRFRMDLFYRLCSDHIETPSLRDQLNDRPQALGPLIRFIAERVAPEEAAQIASEAEQWIDSNIRPDYAWPGNIRELEQCVRNFVVRKTYTPGPDPRTYTIPNNLAWLDDAESRKLSADELLRRYATWVYAESGTYEGTADILQLDRRTVKSKIDIDWLAKMRENKS